MIQLKAGDIFLDLYDEDLPKITLQIEDITTTDTTTTFSRTFRVPATSNNSKFFETAFDVNGYDFDVSQKKSAEILVDGALFKSGEIRLQQVYIDETGNNIDYGVVFLGDVRDFASALGEQPLCQLDFSELSHTFARQTIATSWDAYPEIDTHRTGGLHSGSVLYPLVDFGNTYDSAGVAQETRISAHGTGGVNGKFIHNNVADRLNITRMRPCIRVVNVIDKIFERAGYTYSSTFFNSDLFWHLYVGAWGDKAQVELFPLEEATNSFLYQVQPNTSTRLLINGTTNGDDENWDFDNNTYEAPNANDITFNFRLGVEVDFFASTEEVTGELTFYKVSGGVTTPLTAQNVSIDIQSEYDDTPSDPPVFIRQSAQFDQTFVQTLLAGDEIYANIDIDATSDRPITVIPSITYFQAQGDRTSNIGLSLSCEMKQIDFIKALVNKFRLVIAPDKNNPKNLIIEPWQNYIGTGDVIDWTEKMDISKDVVLTPLFYTQKDTIKFTDKKGEDHLNVRNVNDQGEVYGALDVRSNSEVIQGERTIKNEFQPMPSTQIENSEQVNNGMDNTIIPHIHAMEIDTDDGGTAIRRNNPVKPGVRIFWYNGMKHTGTTSARDQAWYLQDDTFNFISDTKFPMISHFDEWGDRDDSFQGLRNGTVDLSWQREDTYIQFGLAEVLLGQSIYNRYWSTYVESLYDPFSRRLTAYFNLDSQDVANFGFDDVIYVKNAYYYVEKIYDMNVGKRQPVKVDLIKLPNYMPPTDGFIAP